MPILKKLEKINFIIAFILMFTCSSVTTLEYSTVNAQSKIEVSKPKFPHVWRKSNTSLNVFWWNVKDVDGYQVYKYNKKKKKYSKMKTVKPSNTKKTSWIDKGLKENSIQRYKIRSYKKVNGKTKYSKFTYSVRATTYKKGDKVVNAARIKKYDKTIDLGINESKSVKTKIKPSKYSKALKKKVISKKVRLYLNGSKHVRKNKKGKLVGARSGKTSIYVVAHNGNFRKVNVNISDYAYPAKWEKLDEIFDQSREVLTKQKNDLNEVASFFSQRTNIKDVYFHLDENDKLINEGNVQLGGIEETVYRLLYDCPYELRIYIEDGYIEFTVSYERSPIDKFTQVITYYYNYDLPKNHNTDMVRIAKNWTYELPMRI